MVGSLTCGKMVWLPPTSGNHLAASLKTVQLPPTSRNHSAASPKMVWLPPTSGTHPHHPQENLLLINPSSSLARGLGESWVGAHLTLCPGNSCVLPLWTPPGWPEWSLPSPESPAQAFWRWFAARHVFILFFKALRHSGETGMSLNHLNYS